MPQYGAVLPHHPDAEQHSALFPFSMKPVHVNPPVPPHEASVDTLSVGVVVGALNEAVAELGTDVVDKQSGGAANEDVLAVLLPLLGVRYQSFLSFTPRHSARVTILYPCLLM